MRRLVAAAAVAAGIATVSGCGTVTPPDVMLVTRTGSIPGARLSLRITDDGFASCDRKALVQISGHDLIEARAAAEVIADEARAKRRLPARPGSTLQYRVEIQQGTVSFADNSRGQSKSDYEVALITRDVAKGPCRLPR